MSLGLPRDAEALLLVEVDGGVEESREALEEVRSILTRCGATEVRVAADDAERQRLWKSRKGAFTLTSLPAGEYFLAVVPDDATSEWQSKDTLEMLSRTAQRIRVADGDRLTVQVKR